MGREGRKVGGTQRLVKVFLCVLCVLCGGELFSVSSVHAQFQMPDPKQMAGIPRPVTDLPDGSISVRLIRGQLSNNISGHPVEARVGDRVVTVKTDDAGRAQFDKLQAGASVKFTANVDGEQLESQEFPVPSQGGIRLMLVATDKNAAAAAGGPAVSGQVVLSENSRIVFEPGDEMVTVYYILEIVNGGSSPVTPTPPFALDMPKAAQFTTLLEGSTPLARSKGSHISFGGPLPTGKTTLRLAYEVPSDTGDVEISQSFPATLDRLMVLVHKQGDAKLASAQLERQQEFPSEGETIIAGMGGRVTAGQPISLTLSDLPHHSSVPRWAALSIAAGIVLAGVWGATRKEDGGAQEAARKRLVARREKLFGDLVKVERDRRNGRGDPDKLAARREELIGSLEHIYGALDDAEAPAGASA
jgi:hypothetical protein